MQYLALLCYYMNTDGKNLKVDFNHEVGPLYAGIFTYTPELGG